MIRASARLDQLPDAELVALAQAGGRDGLDVLLRRHYDRLHAVCRRITVNEADAYDATQEAMVSIVDRCGVHGLVLEIASRGTQISQRLKTAIAMSNAGSSSTERFAS